MFDYKQVMVVRKDLNMSPGKLAVQVAHASVSAVEEARNKKPDWLKYWKKEKQKKVVVKAETEQRLERLKERAKKLDIPSYLIRDAGLTELEPGTSTVLGVGPGPNDEIDKITGDLPLL